MMIWVDLETTGLRPGTDLILEVGLKVTDDDLTVLEGMNRLVSVNLDEVNERMEPFVAEMHIKSGLLHALKYSTTHKISTLDTMIAGQIKHWTQFFGNGELVPLCGSSVHFDRAFMKVQMPKTEAAFHYRNIDVSGMREMVKLWKPSALDSMPKGQGIHRVDPDLDDTIELARWCRNLLVGPSLSSFQRRPISDDIPQAMLDRLRGEA